MARAPDAVDLVENGHCRDATGGIGALQLKFRKLRSAWWRALEPSQKAALAALGLLSGTAGARVERRRRSAHTLEELIVQVTLPPTALTSRERPTFVHDPHPTVMKRRCKQTAQAVSHRISKCTPGKTDAFLGPKACALNLTSVALAASQRDDQAVVVVTSAAAAIRRAWLATTSSRVLARPLR
jgi:hypothetical protein